MVDAQRPLMNEKEIALFIDKILQITDNKEKREAIDSIRDAERNCFVNTEATTLHRDDNRNYEYRTDEQRELLRQKILKQLKEDVRLDNDDLITLDKGGAKPKTEIQADSQLFYIIGLPASGKSGISNIIADHYGAYILDSDYAKRKLPEFTTNGGASLVHDESDEIIFSQRSDNLLRFCIENKYNMVIPKIGHSKNKVCEFCKRLNTLGYIINLVSVDLDRVAATKRAYNRFKDSHRYIPLSLIFDTYNNQPSLNYFKIKQESPSYIYGYAQISTDVPKGQEPILLEERNIEVLNEIFSTRKTGGTDDGKNTAYKELI